MNGGSTTAIELEGRVLSKWTNVSIEAIKALQTGSLQEEPIVLAPATRLFVERT